MWWNILGNWEFALYWAGLLRCKQHEFHVHDLIAIVCTYGRDRFGRKDRCDCAVAGRAHPLQSGGSILLGALLVCGFIYVYVVRCSAETFRLLLGGPGAIGTSVG